jgi:hypothetical protein
MCTPLTREFLPGTFADYIAGPKRNAIPLPSGLSVLAENDGHVIASVIIHSSTFCKLLITNNLDARGIEPLFPTPTSTKIQERLYPRGTRENTRSWKCLDGAGCY